MGYCITMDVVDFVVRADKVDDCLKTINSLHDPKALKEFATGGSYSGGKRTAWHYAWVNNPENGFASLKDAFEEWRYDANIEPNGDVVVNCFNGEKLGDDKTLFDTIAPFVEDGAYIICTGEDGAHWKWFFRNGKCKELSGVVVYEDDNDF